jgi:branched-chain amino acid transport system ATP-binding protein
MLETRSVSKHFGGVAAVDAVSITVRQGEIAGLIGPNGAGKTTMFNLLAGSQRPSGGGILLNGRRIDDLAAHRRLELGMGRTFQIPRLFGQMSVVENMLTAARGQVGEGILANWLPGHPKLILLDEPAAGVNPSLLETIIDRIQAINATGVTFLIIEHNMDMVTRLCSRALVMVEGKLLCEGAPREVTRDPRVIDAYLGAAA